jgi:hypothetical protein
MAARKRKISTKTTKSTPARKRRNTTRPKPSTDPLDIAVEELDKGGLDIGKVPGGIPSPLEIRRA